MPKEQESEGSLVVEYRRIFRRKAAAAEDKRPFLPSVGSAKAFPRFLSYAETEDARLSRQTTWRCGTQWGAHTVALPLLLSTSRRKRGGRRPQSRVGG